MSTKEKEMPATATLDELQRQLLADQLGVSPDEITPEFLQEVLDNRIYPSARFTRGSAFGGYSNTHLRAMTREEFDAVRRQADAYLEGIKRKVEAK